MIERVARVAADFDGRPFDRLGRADRTRYLDRAKLETEAMREPTEAMVDKAWQMIGSNLRYEEVYGYLIDAALAEPAP